MAKYTPLDAGRLRHVIRIEEQVQIRDEYGGIKIEWREKYNKIYASVEPLSMREAYINNSTQNSITTRIIIRYKDDILPSQRVIFRNNIYNIESVIPDNNSGLEWLTLTCSSGLNEGA